MDAYKDNIEELINELNACRSSTASGDINEIKNAYMGRIPKAINEIWDRVGLGVFNKGYFQLCDPRKYKSIISNIFAGDLDFSTDATHVIGFSAFGRLIAWNENYRIVNIDLVNGQIWCRHFQQSKTDIDQNMSLISGLMVWDQPAADIKDKNGKGMFAKALLRLGALHYGYIYGFRPILALGGSRESERLVVYEALSHMAILSQATPMKLMETGSLSPRVIKLIGQGD